MSGTSETFEISHLDGISEKSAKAVRVLLNHYDLNQIMTFMQNGPSNDFDQQLPSLKEEEWRELLPKVIFCKVTALELNKYYSSDQIHYLIQLFSFCLKLMGQTNKREVKLEDLPVDYLIAQNWLKKAYNLLKAKK